MFTPLHTHTVTHICIHTNKQTNTLTLIHTYTFTFAIFQGTSTKYSPQRVGIQHQMNDEDIIQVVKK